MNNIHKTAIIEDGAIIGDDVTVGAYTIIGKNVKIGNGNTIGSHTVIDGFTTIGDDNKIYSHAALGTEPQDLKFDGEEVELIIGNKNKIREFTLFNPGTAGEVVSEPVATRNASASKVDPSSSSIDPSSRKRAF